MGLAWGLVLIGLGLLAWGGQAVSWFFPATAQRWSLMEGEDSVEPAYFADVRGEALWDLLSLWTLVVAGALLVLDEATWAYFGLVGGGIYVYFAGRGITTRVELRRRGFRIGDPSNVSVAFLLLTIWGVVGIVTIGAAVVALPLV